MAKASRLYPARRHPDMVLPVVLHCGLLKTSREQDVLPVIPNLGSARHSPRLSVY